ncbi:CRTAC1 family protein [Ahrensia kielensis]|uniref:CRTAC1 family protein n=1 Tax=Ahrensia kielensis TaxID=76980 RepID=A0ABU9T805_9HYPH
MNKFALTLTALLTSSPAFANDVKFESRAKAFDFEHIYNGGWEYFVGGGMATFDCNGDAFPDVFLAGGENMSRIAVNTTKQAGAAIQFQNLPNTGAEFVSVTGAYPINIDNDEHIDLFVMRVGENEILRGLGNCHFEEANTLWHFNGLDRWTTSFSATWEENASLPTLAVGNYVDRDNPEGPFGACDVNHLYRPEGLQYKEPITLDPGYCALSMLFSDWTRNGRRDLRISNDRHYYLRDGEEQMFRLDEMRFLTREDGWLPISVWGMGIASQDLNGDKAPDIMLTSMGDQLIQFYAGGAKMENAPFNIGAYAQRPYTGDDGRPSTGWHAEFNDINNDGLADLFIAKGNVDQMPGMAMKDPNNLLVQKTDGTFVEVGLEAGLADTARSRGASIADFNLDGKLDIAVMNRRAAFDIYENASTNSGNFASIKLQQNDSNVDAVGAWIELRTAPDSKVQTQEITIGGGHASGKIGPTHFGLGLAKQAEIRIIWPDGSTSEWTRIEANSRITAKRGANNQIELSPI